MFDKSTMAVGSHTVTAAEETATSATLNLGFSPRYVRIFNYTNGDTVVEHWDGMADGESVDTAAAAVLNAAGSITLTSTGFTMGADIIDTAADVIYYMAIR